MGKQSKTFDVSKPVNAKNLDEMFHKHNSPQHLHRMIGLWLLAQDSAKEEKPAKTKKKEAA